MKFFLMVAAWYLGWGLLNSSIFGPTSPDSVICFVVTGLLVAISSSGQVTGDDHAEAGGSTDVRGLQT